MSRRGDHAGSGEIPAELRIDLKALDGPGPHAIECALTAAWMAESLGELETTVDTAGAVRVVLTEQGDGTVIVRGDMEAAYFVPCARCLAPAAVEASADLLLTFVPEGRQFGWNSPEASRGEGLKLTADALEELTYKNGIVDLADLVGEQLALAYPIRALCSRGEACRGLCTQCGHELNAVPPDVSACPACGHRSVGATDATPEWKKKLAKLRGPD